MKQFAILIAAIAMVGFTTSESQAQHFHGRHFGYGHGGHFHNVGRSSFNISVGNGFNGISVGRGYGYGGFARPVVPVYGGFNSFRPVYGGFGGYGGFGPGVSINVGRGFGGYGYGGGFYRGGCGW